MEQSWKYDKIQILLNQGCLGTNGFTHTCSSHIEVRWWFAGGDQRSKITGEFHPGHMIWDWEGKDSIYIILPPAPYLESVLYRKFVWKLVFANLMLDQTIGPSKSSIQLSPRRQPDVTEGRQKAKPPSVPPPQVGIQRCTTLWTQRLYLLTAAVTNEPTQPREKCYQQREHNG